MNLFPVEFPSNFQPQKSQTSLDKGIKESATLSAIPHQTHIGQSLSETIFLMFFMVAGHAHSL